MGRAIIVAVGLWLTTLAAIVLSVALWPVEQPLPAHADAIVCLGAGVSQTDPSLPDPASDRRARTCAGLHAAGSAPVVVFTGYGVEGFSAAEAMAARAISLGLPIEATVQETTARSTIQNAAYSLDLLAGETNRVIVVSDAFHLPRAWVIFRAVGVSDVALYATAGPETDASDRMPWDWILRESVAVWFNVARAATYLAAGIAGIDRETRIDWFN